MESPNMTSREELAIETATAVGVQEYGPLTRNWSFTLKQLTAFYAHVRGSALEEAARAARDHVPSSLSAETEAVMRRNGEDIAHRIRSLAEASL
jgi:hypothetical protein